MCLKTLDNRQIGKLSNRHIILMNLFEQLGLDEPILRAITDMGFETPSEIQQKAIPTLLEDDTDMVALAQTGTGKTGCLWLPSSAAYRH